MSCHHAKDDPACGSSKEGQERAAAESRAYASEQRAKNLKEAQETISRLREENEHEIERIKREALRNIPNPDDFEITNSEQIGKHLILKVQYPACAACAYEGNKVLVYLDTPMRAALRWRHIDPHFRSTPAPNPQSAPPPAARFPASPQGWADAMEWARTKST